MLTVIGMTEKQPFFSYEPVGPDHSPRKRINRPLPLPMPPAMLERTERGTHYFDRVCSVCSPTGSENR